MALFGKYQICTSAKDWHPPRVVDIWHKLNGRIKICKSKELYLFSVLCEGDSFKESE